MQATATSVTMACCSPQNTIKLCGNQMNLKGFFQFSLFQHRNLDFFLSLLVSMAELNYLVLNEF
jgi:hypothetical protein